MTQMVNFNPRNWYWIVGGSTTQVYSSAAGDYVPVADSTYQAWLTSRRPTAIASEADLGAVLAQCQVRPVNASILSIYQTALANDMDMVQNRILFNHENRVRALEGKAAITAAQFIAGVAGLL